MKEHKKIYRPHQSPDSIWSRSSSKRQAGQFGGKEIQKILGIENEEPQDPSDKDPIKLMDIVYDIWGVTDDEEKEDDEENSED